MNSRFLTAALLASFSLAVFFAETQEPKREFQLQAISDDFWTLFERQAKLSTVASGFGFTEGPVWDPAGFVYVSDEVTNKLFRVYMDGRREELLPLGDPDGNTYDREKRTTMRLNMESRLEDAPMDAERAFWESLAS